MQSNRSIEAVDSTDRDDTSRSSRGLLGKLLSVIRGDKYMAGAYPPDWPGSGAASATHGKEG